jgi:hypothetical protein
MGQAAARVNAARGGAVAVRSRWSQPDARLHALQLRDVIARVMRKRLSPLQHAVVTLRFGLADGDELTFAEIAARTGHKREHCTQACSEALRRLRFSPSLRAHAPWWTRRPRAAAVSAEELASALRARFVEAVRVKSERVVVAGEVPDRDIPRVMALFEALRVGDRVVTGGSELCVIGLPYLIDGAPFVVTEPRYPPKTVTDARFYLVPLVQVERHIVDEVQRREAMH